MKRYFFGWWSRTGDQLTLTGDREISVEVFNDIREMTAYLGHFLSDQLYYGMLCKNFREVLDYIEKFETAAEAFQYHHEYIPYANELNRLMINALGSVFTYLNHFETAFKKEDLPTELAHFKATTQRFFDEYFLYRFFYKMRNYAIHFGLPVTLLQDSIAEPGKTFYFDRDALLEDFDWGGIVTADLKNGADKYCVKELAAEALEMYREFHMEILSKRLEQVMETMKSLERFSRVTGEYREFPVFLIIDEEQPDKPPSIQAMITDQYISVENALRDLAEAEVKDR